MKKNKNTELKKKEVGKNVLEKSKKISKDPKKNVDTKKKLKKNVSKKVIKALASNGSSAADAVIKHDKHKKGKQKKSKTNQNVDKKNISDKELAKIEKKKAKKLAKKLKKKEIKKARVSESSKTKYDQEITKTTNQKIGAAKVISEQKSKKHGEDQDNKEPKERDYSKEAATVFIGNLPVNTKRAQLVRLFADYAPINGIRFRTASGKVLFKHKHRKEAGSLNAWVVLKDEETATRALDLNGTVFKNNHLRITRSDLNSSSTDIKRTVFVGNLKYSANEEKLRDIFSSCGDIDYVRCLRDDKGCKGVAYVCFKTPEALGLALELNETMLDERPIHVERYSVKKLGAKKARAATVEEAKKVAPSGRDHKGKKDKVTKAGASNNTDDGKKAKFRGVKVDNLKKKQKKNVNSQMQKLAKKIAPRVGT